MQIEYLKKLKDYPKGRKEWTNEGMSIPEISSLETQYNKATPFPTAFREFLFLAGKYCHLDLDILDFEEMQQLAEKELKKYEQTIDRPFFVLDQLHGCEQFSFIYLDEQEEDPNVYFCNVAYLPNVELIQKSGYGKLSEYINHHIGEAKAMEEG